MIKGLIEDIVLLLVIIGAAWGVWHWASNRPVIETPAVAVVQSDASVVLARTATNSKAKPKQIIPKKAKVERIAQVTVKPTVVNGDGIKVDMTLFREPDGSRRVVASSPDGVVVGGVDIPVETPSLEGAHPWAAGLNFDPIHQTPGVWMDRDMGRLRVGVEVNVVKDRQSQYGGEIRAKLGWRF